MQLVPANTKIDFMKFRFMGATVSLVLIIGSILMWFDKGPDKYGLDFLGGAEVVGRFAETVDISTIRSTLEEAGYAGAVVQEFEQGTNDFSIRIKSDKSEDTVDELRKLFENSEGSGFELLKEDFVGPVIGEQIREKGIKAIVYALICILIYISFRFEWRFAVGAIIALVHDVIVTTGIYVMTDKEISASVLAALLTIIGYSLNDTIIVYDRVRENLGKSQRDKKSGKTREPLKDIVNKSINQTLSRTLLTSLTTFFVVFVLWFLGGGAVADLALTLVIGVVAGTYSSIFVASPVLLIWDKEKTS